MSSRHTEASADRGGQAEHERLAQLASYDILDTAPEEAFDDLATLAATLTDAPIALVSLIDADRQWFKARIGIDAHETPRSDALCDWAIREPGSLFVVPDACADPRFADNPLVLGEPRIRFYAGVPLRAREGGALGTICIIDPEPRPALTAAQEAGLRIVARQVERQLELRRVTRELLRSRRRSWALVEQASDLVLVLTADGTITFVSAAAMSMLGFLPAERMGTNALDLIHPEDVHVALTSLGETAGAPGMNVPLELRVAHADGSWRHVEVVSNNQLDDPDLAGIVMHVRDVTFRKEVEERVQRGERQLAEAQRVARMGSWEQDLPTGEMVWSEGLFHLFGLDSRTTKPSLTAWSATMHPDERRALLAVTEQAARDGRSFTFRRRVIRPDGTEVLALCYGEADLDAEGSPCRLRGTVLDITEQTLLERSLDTERRFLRAVLDNLDEGVVACDADGSLTLFNPATERLHRAGFEPILLREVPEIYDLYSPDGVTPLEPEDVPLFRAFTHGRVSHEEIVIAPMGGDQRLVSCNGQAIFDEQGERLGAVVTMRDITEQRRVEETLRRLADHDVLTGLSNRAVFSSRLEAALEDGTRVAVLFIDLDDFKRINDDHGHDVGDRVIATVGDRLRSAVKEGDTAARLGGDEFVLLVLDVAEAATAERIADRLRRVLAEPMKVGELLLHPGGSVGWALPEPGERDAEAVLSRADHAMYRQKQLHRSSPDRRR